MLTELDKGQTTALEMLLSLRASAVRAEMFSLVTLTLYWGAAIGTLLVLGFILLEMSKTDEFNFTQFLVCWGIGILVAYPFVRVFFKRLYGSAEALLNTTDLPQRLLDSGFQDQLLEAVNSYYVVMKRSAPRSFEEQIRFVARYWFFMQWVIKDSSVHNIQRTRLEPWALQFGVPGWNPKMESQYVGTRIRAICDYFIANITP